MADSRLYRKTLGGRIESLRSSHRLTSERVRLHKLGPALKNSTYGPVKADVQISSLDALHFVATNKLFVSFEDVFQP